MRRRLLLVLMLLVPASAFGQGARHDSIVLGPRGLPVAGATITVCTSAGTGTPCTPLASIFTNQALTTAATNPFQADALGNYGFFAPPGTYILTITGPQVQTPITMTVILGCPPGGSGCPAGTVTSVGFSAPTQFTVSNSPVTSSAIIALGWANALANCVFAGPTSGAAAAPTCRALVAADLPPGNVVAVYSTPSNSTTTNISLTTMTTSGASGNKYQVTATALLTAAGVGCTGTTTLQFNVTSTDAVTLSSFTTAPGGFSTVSSGFSIQPTLASSGNGTVGTQVTWLPLVINITPNTLVRYSTNYTLGAGCTTGPTYYILPVVLQVQ